MGQLNGVRFCGRRGGLPFVDVLRPDPKTLNCPKGSEPCSNFTKPSNTICMSPDLIENGICPITSLEIGPYPNSSNFTSS